MNRLIALCVFVFLVQKIAYCQIFFSVNHDYNYFIERAVIDSVNYHSSIKPQLFSNIKIDSGKLSKQFHYKDGLLVNPIINSRIYAGNDKISSINQLGAGSFYNLSKNLLFHVAVSGHINNYPNFISESIDSNRVAPFVGRADKKFNNTYIFFNFRGTINYNPRKYLTLSFGHDNHFWGDGYRSLFLSNYSAPYTFGSFNLQAWRLKYTSMWAYLPDINFLKSNTNFYGKYGSFHYLTVNLTRRLSFGFFESVISWQSDSSTNRGFELSYLNPFIFYRSIEYSLHSPDNALMGGTIKLRLWKKTYLYGQLFLDDLMVKELFRNNGWYGNKYAIQLGYKCFNLFNIEDLYFQQEINYIRPYTYAHSEPLTYGVRYQALAHPLGANLQEALTSIRYAKNNWYFTGFISFTRAGMDTSTISYGQNIYKSNRYRMSNFGITHLQGQKTNNLIFACNVNYLIHKEWNSYVFAALNLRHVDGGRFSRNDVLFSIGIKTLLYHNDFDW